MRLSTLLLLVLLSRIFRIVEIIVYCAILLKTNNLFFFKTLLVLIIITKLAMLLGGIVDLFSKKEMHMHQLERVYENLQNFFKSKVKAFLMFGLCLAIALIGRLVVLVAVVIVGGIR